MDELITALGPILVSVAISLGGALVITRYAGPAQAAYVTALERRLAVVQTERDDCEADMPTLKQRISELEREVEALKRDGAAKDREIADLYRRLVADERRLTAGEAETRQLHQREARHD